MVRRSEYATTWRVDLPADRVWRLMADTARFNEAVGLPRHDMEETPLPDGDVERVARMKAGPVEMEWIERPYEWVAGQWFRHDIHEFRRGPIRSMLAATTLQPDGDGTRIEYALRGDFAGPAGLFMCVSGFLRKSAERVAAIAKKALQPGSDAPAAMAGLLPAPTVEAERLDRLAEKLGQSEFAHGLAPRLAELLKSAMEADIDPIRPRTLARQWEVPERAAVELCLAAVHAGILDMSWDILCPRCRGAKAASETLGALQQEVHCPSCNIDYGAELSRNVEVTFRPNPAIRRLEMGAYCLSGPMTTPHVVAQLHVEAGARREESAIFPAGPYRVRTIEPGPSAQVDISDAGLALIRLTDDGFAFEGDGTGGKISLENNTSRARTFVLESRAWAVDALTGHEATTFQAFRDLFPNQVLERGDDMGVESVTFLFTDIRGSTALYERVGDGRAYEIVRDHFVELTNAVRANNGAIVKTIGDAVMACFAKPADAVQAALQMQGGHHAFGEKQEEIILKIGLHTGPSISVNLNDRLDYFGSTVNLAARLQGESRGGDVVLSEAFVADAEAMALLKQFPGGMEQSRLKGFDSPVSFYRCWPGEMTEAA